MTTKWVERRRGAGYKVPERVSLTVTVDRGLAREVWGYCEEMDLTVSQLLRRLLAGEMVKRGGSKGG